MDESFHVQFVSTGVEIINVYSVVSVDNTCVCVAVSLDDFLIALVRSYSKTA